MNVHAFSEHYEKIAEHYSNIENMYDAFGKRLLASRLTSVVVTVTVIASFFLGFFVWGWY